MEKMCSNGCVSLQGEHRNQHRSWRRISGGWSDAPASAKRMASSPESEAELLNGPKSRTSETGNGHARTTLIPHGSGKLLYRPFDLPDYHIFLDALGVAPEHSGEGTQQLQFQVDEDEMVVTLDSLGGRFMSGGSAVIGKWFESFVKGRFVRLLTRRKELSLL